MTVPHWWERVATLADGAPDKSLPEHLFFIIETVSTQSVLTHPRDHLKAGTEAHCTVVP